VPRLSSARHLKQHSHRETNSKEIPAFFSILLITETSGAPEDQFFHYRLSPPADNMAQLQGYSTFKHFLVTRDAEYVAHVQINRPKKLNAFFEEMWIEIGQIFAKLSQDPNVRAIILSGAGDRAFTAGLDVQAASQGGGGFAAKSSEKLDGARFATKLRRHIHEFQECITKIEKCEKRMLSMHPRNTPS
jgi:hypothetical protein